MNCKIIFLAILLLSTIAVTIAATQPNSEILTSFRASFPKALLDEQIPLEPIDVDGPGG